MTTIETIYFASTAEWRDWLEQHHADTPAVWLGFYKKATGKPTMVYSEALDEALCYGWIDGVRNAVDEERYINRYSPRKKGSKWSYVNIKRVNELIEQGRMTPAGLKAFEARDEQTTYEAYSPEVRNRGLDEAAEAEFQKHPQAWAFFQSQAPSYQKGATFWVNSAKQEVTRQKRLATLIEDSQNGRKIKPLAGKPKT